MQKLIEKLKNVDDILLKSSYSKGSGVRVVIAEIIEELKQQSSQAYVSGWQEFETMPPNVGDTVLVKSKRTGRLQIWEIKAEDFSEEYLKAYCWIYPPACG